MYQDIVVSQDEALTIIFNNLDPEIPADINRVELFRGLVMGNKVKSKIILKEIDNLIDELKQVIASDLNGSDPNILH